MGRCFLVLIFLGAVPLQSMADFCNAPASSATRHEFEFLAGYSPASTTLIGTTNDRRLILAGFAYSYHCWSVGSTDIRYTATFLPVAMVLQPTLPNFRAPTPPAIPAHAVYGISALPVGFSFRFGHRAIEPFVDTHGGIIASAQPIPINASDATGLNFLFDFGAGLHFKIDHRSALNVGYKFLHISNAYTTPFNPGLDNNVLFVSFSLLR